MHLSGNWFLYLVATYRIQFVIIWLGYSNYDIALGEQLHNDNVSTANFMELKAFWIVELCRLVQRYEHFGGACGLHLRGKISCYTKGDYAEQVGRFSPFLIGHEGA